jgi:hypothetical protein
MGVVVQATRIFAFAFAAHRAERVIDDAPCDIQDLIHEPSHFKFATAQ